MQPFLWYNVIVKKQNPQEHYTAYQLKLPVEIEKIIGISDFVGVNQLNRYMNASQIYDQDFYIPLYEGYSIGSFIIPYKDGFIAVSSKHTNKTSEKNACGNGVIYYELCKSKEEAIKCIKVYDANVDEIEEYNPQNPVPVPEPQILYSIYTNPVIQGVAYGAIGIVVIGEIAYFAIPAITAAVSFGADAMITAINGAHYALFPVTACVF